MKDLIEALQIFLKYTNTRYPTYCDHDVMYIMDVKPTDVSDDDIKRLNELGFLIDETDDLFFSFRFGSA